MRLFTLYGTDRHVPATERTDTGRHSLIHTIRHGPSRSGTGTGRHSRKESFDEEKLIENVKSCKFLYVMSHLKYCREVLQRKYLERNCEENEAAR